MLTLGRVEYLQSLPAPGRLFPLLKANPAGYFGANFGKLWATYLRVVVKLTTSAYPSHVFRHTFKTFCMAAGIPEDVYDAITGHIEGRGVARAYGTMPPVRMAQEIEKLPSALTE